MNKMQLPLRPWFGDFTLTAEEFNNKSFPESDRVNYHAGGDKLNIRIRVDAGKR